MIDEMRKKVMEEITDFWINFIYGDSPSSLVDANNNEVNLRHLKRVLGITELEKKLDEFEAVEYDDAWDKRIEKIEKKLETLISRYYKDTADHWGNVHKPLNKKLSELKGRIDRLIKHGHPGIKIKGDQNFEEIKELKGEGEVHSEQILADYNQRTILKEVLREVLILLKRVMPDSWAYFQMIQDKLGGEKMVDALDGKTETPTSSIQANSKPPSCEFCGRDLILYKEKWICGHGCTKPAINPSEEDTHFIGGKVEEDLSSLEYHMEREYEIASGFRDSELEKIRLKEKEPIEQVEIQGITNPKVMRRLMGEKEPTESEYDEHLSWKENLRKLMKGKVMVKKEELEKIKEINNDPERGISRKQSEINWFLNKYLEEEYGT